MKAERVLRVLTRIAAALGGILMAASVVAFLAGGVYVVDWLGDAMYGEAGR